MKHWLISQGSVTIALRQCRQNYSHLWKVTSRQCEPKIIRISQCFTQLL